MSARPFRFRARSAREPRLEERLGVRVHEYALRPIVWIVTTAFRAIGGEAATVLFGNAAALLSDGTDLVPKVPAIRVGGGTAFVGDQSRSAFSTSTWRTVGARAPST
jgi:hypothetical protein